MSQTKEIPLMEKIVSLCKRRGFIYQSSEIYGGINGFWDYGPLGAELKRNLRDTWWRAMTRDREDVVGLDATIIMHPAIWKASGRGYVAIRWCDACDEEAVSRGSRRTAAGTVYRGPAPKKPNLAEVEFRRRMIMSILQH
jgi:hypothetical protein